MDLCVTGLNHTRAPVELREKLAVDERTLPATLADLRGALGLGISTPELGRVFGGWAAAAVVGSALVSVIAEAGASADLDTRVEEYVRWLKA